MTEFFANIISSPYVSGFTEQDPFQITLHNGDNDLACDFMEAEYFVENLRATYGGEVNFCSALKSLLPF